MKITVKLNATDLEKINAIRKQKAEEAEVDAFMKRALENAIPWSVGLEDADVEAYRKAREEGRRLSEKYGDCTPETLVTKLESLNHENLLLKGLIRDLCGSICGDGYDPKLTEQEQAKAAFEKLEEHQAHEQEMKAEISKLYTRSTLTEGCLRDLCGSIDDEFNAANDPATMTRAALEKFVELRKKKEALRDIEADLSAVIFAIGDMLEITDGEYGTDASDTVFKALKKRLGK